MKLEVLLKQEVIKSIKHTGKRFDKVIIETDAPCSTGLFHIKLRHLDDFLEYFLRDKKIESSSVIERYSQFTELNSRDKCALQEYYSLFLDFNKAYAILEKYPGAINKLRKFIGSKKGADNNFSELLYCSNDKDYQNTCYAIKTIFNHFVKSEECASVLVSLNQNILNCLTEIIQDPVQIYFNKKRQDFTFCSEEYQVQYVITLKIGQPGLNVAYIFTGFKTNNNILKKDREMQCIYKRKNI